MPDINDLDLDKEAGIEQDKYERPSEFMRPPDPGEYTFRRDGDVVKGVTKQGDRSYKFNGKVVGSPFNGQTVDMVAFTTPSQYRNSTSADDYVRATGSRVTPANGGSRPTVRDYDNAVQYATGPFNAVVGWKGYCSTCEDETVGKRGTPAFPIDPATGKLNHIMECPRCGEKIGARAKVKRFVVPE